MVVKIKGILLNRKKKGFEKCWLFKKNTKIWGITSLESVSFMVGWLDGWMDTFFLFHTPVPTRPYTRASRGEPSLRSELEEGDR